MKFRENIWIHIIQNPVPKTFIEIPLVYYSLSHQSSYKLSVNKAEK